MTLSGLFFLVSVGVLDQGDVHSVGGTDRVNDLAEVYQRMAKKLGLGEIVGEVR